MLTKTLILFLDSLDDVAQTTAMVMKTPVKNAAKNRPTSIEYFLFGFLPTILDRPAPRHPKVPQAEPPSFRAGRLHFHNGYLRGLDRALFLVQMQESFKPEKWLSTVS
jgi:hypothetical protein